MLQDYSFNEIFVAMIGNIAVINVLAFVLQDRQVHVTDVRARGKHKIALGLLGGLFGIYATISGFPMPDGSIVTIRDFGPLMAGCLGEGKGEKAR